MAIHSIDLDVAGAFAPPRTCPSCDHEGLSPWTDEQGVTFNCARCGRTWSLELGALVPVGPDRCPPCRDELPCSAHGAAATA